MSNDAVRKPHYWGYIRVSTVDQANNGLSLDAQTDMLKQSYERNWKPKGYEFGAILVDPAVRGKKPMFSRGAGSRLRTDAVRGDVVEFTAIDRAFRSMRDGANVKNHFDTHGVKCSFINTPGAGDNTAMGNLMFGMMVLFAELDSSIRSERVMMVQEEMRKRGGVPARWLTVKRGGVEGKGRKRWWNVDVPLFEIGQFVVYWRDTCHLTWWDIELKLRLIPRPGKPARNYVPLIGRTKNFLRHRPWQKDSIRALYHGTKKTIGLIEAGKISGTVGSWKYDPKRATRRKSAGSIEGAVSAGADMPIERWLDGTEPPAVETGGEPAGGVEPPSGP